MSRKVETDRVQLARVLTQGHLRVRLMRKGAVVSTQNGLAVVAAVFIVAFVGVFLI